ncbi:TetR/AcrR family transcriptional regulator [Cellulomonas soli]|uniref:HTH tetR-type domain-containing protein n=1 Tax=Cellulomonas soli TaxID=931535 RepID=A0A512P8G8_9CELL|nr:TetR/AcrR family transcriptional regulator [Cellulomonas soli]NYI57722.1 AcrR family transcriptional regulator [Cellulomonas soli]GEP67503.1 hypothetical protein CSO01_02180 [Cellulomonas soli]
MEAPRRRGRTRSDSARLAVLEATRSLIAELGYERLSIERIAARAGVGKQTIYRWWPSKSAVIAEGLLEGMLMPGPFECPRTDDVVADVTAWFVAIVRGTRDPDTASLLRSLVAAASESRDVAARLEERVGGAPLAVEERLQAAVHEGAMHPQTPVTLLTEGLIGVLVLRALRREELGEQEAADVVAAMLTSSLTG